MGIGRLLIALSVLALSGLLVTNVSATTHPRKPPHHPTKQRRPAHHPTKRPPHHPTKRRPAHHPTKRRPPDHPTKQGGRSE